MKSRTLFSNSFSGITSTKVFIWPTALRFKVSNCYKSRSRPNLNCSNRNKWMEIFNGKPAFTTIVLTACYLTSADVHIRQHSCNVSHGGVLSSAARVPPRTMVEGWPRRHAHHLPNGRRLPLASVQSWPSRMPGETIRRTEPLSGSGHGE